MAVPLIVAGSILLIDKIGGKIIRDKKEQEAKKDGAEIAAQAFAPLIDMIKECTGIVKAIVIASQRDLEMMLGSLEDELFRLEDIYDEVCLRKNNLYDSNVKKLGTSRDLDGSRENTDKHFMALSSKIGLAEGQDATDSFEKIKIIFSGINSVESNVCIAKGFKICSVAGPVSSILTAVSDDYDEIRMEQFEKTCVVWSKRLDEERSLFFAELDKYQELIKSGEAERIYYQCRIFERVNQIANMKMLINMYGEL